MVKAGLIKKSNQRFNRKMLKKGRDWWRSFFHRVPVYSGNKVPFCSRKKHIKIHFFLTVLTFARAPNGTSSTLFSDRFDFSRSRFSRACWVSSWYLASSLSWGRSNTTRGNTPTPDRVILLGSKWATLTCSTKQMKSRKDYVQRKGMLASSLTSVCIFSILFYTFPKMLTRRICLLIKSFFRWRSFPSSCDLNGWFRGDITRRN